MVARRWQDWQKHGLEHLVVDETKAGVVAESLVLAGGAKPFAAKYRIVCDPDWKTRRVEVTVVGGSKIVLVGDGRGLWRDGEGRSLEGLSGAIDIDLSASPFTNTLPIRRLDLSPSESADIWTVFVSLPELEVFRDPQRYTCLKRRRRYLFESLDSPFKAEIETDEAGFVTRYPGLFRVVH